MSVAVDLVKIFGPIVVKEVRKRLPKALENNPDEIKKHCRVCGERITKDATYVLYRRFRCAQCGHRTHVHCAEGNPEQKCCKSCA